MISGFLFLLLVVALILPLLNHRDTGRDGLYHVILWLCRIVTLAGRGLFAVAEGYARFRNGFDAALAAGRVEAQKAFSEAEVRG
jgi:hypothetical protein